MNQTKKICVPVQWQYIHELFACKYIVLVLYLWRNYWFREKPQIQLKIKQQEK